VNIETCTFHVFFNDVEADFLEEFFPAIIIAAGSQIFVGGVDVPERRIDRIVVGFAAVIVEAVGDQAFGLCRAKELQDTQGLFISAGGQEQAWKGDEGISTPVAEPREAGEDGPFAFILQVVTPYCKTTLGIRRE
jgi:hypothetical protein